jgi:hypothetical protein
MTTPTTIFETETGAVSAPRRRAKRWFPFARERAPERDAESCLSLFLAAALRPGTPGSESLAAILFARGAVDGAANRAGLGPAARARLERSLYRAVAGSRGRAVAGWRRALSELAQTQQGRVIRRRGEAALHAWLAGAAPGPRLAAVLAPSPQAPVEAIRSRARG